MLWGKAKLPRGKHLLHQAIAGFFMISLGNGLVAWAEMHIPSGIAAIICSLMPLVVILVNLTVNRDERPNFPIIVGTIIGFLGIVLIFSEHLNAFSNAAYGFAILLTFLAVVSWAGGSVWIKKKNTTDNPFMNAGLHMFFGGIWMIPFSVAFDDLSSVQWSIEAAYALVYLVIVGSLIAYTCYSYALRNLPMTIVSLYAYINPLVAVVLGWLILDETLTLRMGFAIVLTIAGIYIVNRGYQLRGTWKTELFTDRR